MTVPSQIQKEYLIAVPGTAGFNAWSREIVKTHGQNIAQAPDLGLYRGCSHRKIGVILQWR
jgi:hypothetical protein